MTFGCTKRWVQDRARARRPAQAACWPMDGTLRALKEQGTEAEFFASLAGMDEVGAWFRGIGTASVKEIEGLCMASNSTELPRVCDEGVAR